MADHQSHFTLKVPKLSRHQVHVDQALYITMIEQASLSECPSGQKFGEGHNVGKFGNVGGDDYNFLVRNGHFNTPLNFDRHLHLTLHNYVDVLDHVFVDNFLNKYLQYNDQHTQSTGSIGIDQKIFDEGISLLVLSFVTEIMNEVVRGCHRGVTEVDSRTPSPCKSRQNTGVHRELGIS